MVLDKERLKRLKFIKKGSPKKFNAALKSGELVPSAEEMNELLGLNKKKLKI